MSVRRILGYLRAVVLWALAICIIGVAVIVALGRVAAPYADELRPRVEEYLTERLRQPVSIARIEARWPRLMPRVTLHDVTFGGGGEPAVHIDELLLVGEIRGLLTPGRNPVRLVLSGITGDVARQDNGRWRFGLFGTTGLELDPRVLNLGDFRLVDSEIVFRPYGGEGVIWRVEQARIQRRGPDVGIMAEAEPEGRLDGRIRLQAHLTMDGGEVAAARADLFVSIHVNWIAERVTRGVETYFLGSERPYAWNEVKRAATDALDTWAVTVPVPPLLVGGVGALAEAWGALTGTYPPLNRDKAREIRHACTTCSSAKAARDAGYEQQIPLDEGVAETIRWYEERGWL